MWRRNVNTKKILRHLENGSSSSLSSFFYYLITPRMEWKSIKECIWLQIEFNVHVVWARYNMNMISHPRRRVKMVHVVYAKGKSICTIFQLDIELVNWLIAAQINHWCRLAHTRDRFLAVDKSSTTHDQREADFFFIKKKCIANERLHDNRRRRRHGETRVLDCCTKTINSTLCILLSSCTFESRLNSLRR